MLATSPAVVFLMEIICGALMISGVGPFKGSSLNLGIYLLVVGVLEVIMVMYVLFACYKAGIKRPVNRSQVQEV